MFRFAFLVEHARELNPQLSLGDHGLALLTIPSEEFRSRLARELPSRVSIESLRIGTALPAVIVEVDEDDEHEALLTAYHQAAITLAPYSLISPEREGFDFSRSRPTVLPNALILDFTTDPPLVDFRYEAGPGVLRLTIGPEALRHASQFNDAYVRKVGELYPRSLLEVGSERCPLAIRIARSMYWFSQGEGHRDPVMAFVCYWVGLEGLVLKSSTQSGKRRRLVYRLGQLARYHEPSAEWADRVGILWDSRSDVVHEGRGGAQTGLFAEIDAGDLNDVKYLFLISLLYALEQHAVGLDIEDLWESQHADAYAPTTELRRVDVPGLVQALRLARRDRPIDETDAEIDGDIPGPPPVTPLLQHD